MIGARRFAPALVLAGTFAAAPLMAQEATTGLRSAIALGLGVGSSSMSVGGTRSSVSGLHGVVRYQHRKFALELELHPYTVPSPVLDEGFRSLYALAGLRLPLGSRVYALPSLGLQFRTWTGSQRVTASDRGFAIGAVLGATLPLGERTTLSPEITYRAAVIEIEGSVSTRVLAARLLVARRF